MAGSDVLVTRGPPHFVLDRTETGENVGCEEFRAPAQRTCPQLRVFGHIHQGRGWRRLGTTHVNASNCVGYRGPLNPAPVVDLRGDLVAGKPDPAALALRYDQPTALTAGHIPAAAPDLAVEEPGVVYSQHEAATGIAGDTQAHRQHGPVGVY